MPKDKTATHEKLVPIVKQEFLKFGYEKASVNHIAKLAGLSAAGLYRHYKDKEDMFASLVDDTLMAYDELCQRWQNGSINDVESYDPFGDTWINEMLDFTYEHFDALKLLICCSAGSKYDNFEEQLIAREEASSKAFSASLKKVGKTPVILTDEQWHLMATLFIRSLTEIIRHDMPIEKSREHIAFIKKFLYPGMRSIFGI